MSWTSAPISVIDFEGGLASGVVEYGVVQVIGGKIGDVRTRICRPTGPVPAADTAIHGLTGTEPAEPFSAEWDYFSDLRKTTAFAAHFAGVENSMLQATWPVGWGSWLDTARLSEHFHPNLGSLGLESVVSALGLTKTLSDAATQLCPPARRRYHCALHDALASALLLCALAADPARGGQAPRAAGMSLKEMLVISTRNQKRREGLVQERLF